MEKNIDIDQVYLDRFHLRATVTVESVKQLADSISGEGLLNAICVRDRPEGGYSLIAGRRRLEACRHLGWKQIPCRVIDAPELDEIPALSENLMRLNLNPVEEADAVRKLHDEKGLSIREIAERTHHGTSWVQDRLAIHALDQALKDAIASRYLSISAALMLSMVTDVELRKWYIHIAKVNGASVNQCEAWLLAWRAQQMLTQPDQHPSGYTPAPGVRGPYTIRCFACRHDYRLGEVGHVALCPSCHEELVKAADQLAEAIEDPGNIATGHSDHETDATPPADELAPIEKTAPTN